MKNDLLDVLSKYLIVDHDSIELEIKRSGSALTLVSNIRVTDVQSDSTQTTVAEVEPA